MLRLVRSLVMVARSSLGTRLNLGAHAILVAEQIFLLVIVDLRSLRSNP